MLYKQNFCDLAWRSLHGSSYDLVPNGLSHSTQTLLCSLKSSLPCSYTLQRTKPCNVDSLKTGISLLIPDANTHNYGINSLKFRGSVFGKNLPANLKEFQSLLEFKLLLKQSGSLPCTCSACRNLKVFHLRGSAYFKIYVFNHMV